MPEARRIVRERLGLPPDTTLAVGIDRFDYTKGILERLNAVERLLEKHPEWIERFVFVQVAAPTRSALEEYKNFQERVERLTLRINERFGRPGYQPVHLLAQHHDSHAVNELLRAADMCIVTSLHDGMNLVSKEFVAARDDEQGVLILSRFAGAAREMTEALIVNPYHVEETADALHRAAHDAGRRAARAHGQPARDGARVQRVPLGRPHAHRRGTLAPEGARRRARGALSPRRRSRSAGAVMAESTPPMLRPLLGPQGLAALTALVRSPALFAFDFDGTLAPIRPRPDDVQVSATIALRLEKLARVRPVAIVTGRRIADVRERLGFVPAWIVGNHGAEDDGDPDAAARAHHALDALRERLRAREDGLVARGRGRRGQGPVARAALPHRARPRRRPAR